MHRANDDDGDNLRLLSDKEYQVHATTTSNHHNGSASPIRRHSINHNPAQQTTSVFHFWTKPFQFVDTHIKGMLARSGFHGWRMGVLFGSCLSAVILCFNIGFLMFARSRGRESSSGFAEPFSYDASNISLMSSSIHIVINVLSTILLSASNYTMQVLSSPTRGEIDRAHWRGKWFDVGVLSVRNLRNIAPRRKLLCTILMVSSVPLHLFYNSAVTYTSTSYQFDTSWAPSDSPEVRSMKNNPNFTFFPNQEWRNRFREPIVLYDELYLTIDRWANATNGVTIKAPELSVSKNETRLQEDLPVYLARDAGGEYWLNFTWLYSGYPGRQKLAHVVDGYARKATPRDRLQLNLNFLAIVILCNAVKLVVMLWVLLSMKDSDFVVTLGDAAASFIKRPDPATEGFCVFSKEAVQSEVAHISIRRPEQQGFESVELNAYHGSKLDPLDELLLAQDFSFQSLQPGVKKPLEGDSGRDPSAVWHVRRLPFSSSLGKDIGTGSSFMVLVVLATLTLCIVVVVFMAKQRINLQWGTSANIILGNRSGNTSLMALAANAPQIILSICYFAVNSECTSMAGAYEWNKFGTLRKSLRVTRPLGEQRSTYFLSLPYRFSLPLIGISGILHWLLSQSIYLLRIDMFDRAGNLDPDLSKAACAISGLSFIVLCGTYYILLTGVSLLGRKHMEAKIPFAASCSLVISAACHVPRIERDAHLKRLQWGVVKERLFGREMHCSLSSRPVETPVPGMIYL